MIKKTTLFLPFYGLASIFMAAFWGSVSPSAQAQEIAAFASNECPSGWEEWEPGKGQFLRGSVAVGSSSIWADPDGPRAPGEVQRDQLQRFTGNFSTRNRSNGTPGTFSHEGAFSKIRIHTSKGPFNSKGTSNHHQKVFFDSGDSPDARVSSSTDGETRPTNVAVLYCIRSPGNSDERLKENFSSLDSVQMLDRLMQVRPTYYEWKNEQRGEGRQIGLIAQEVQKVFPELVYSESEWDDEDQSYLSIQYDKVSVPLISAVQALNEERKKLREHGDAFMFRQERLQRNSRDMETRLDRLEARLVKKQTHQDEASND